MTKIVLAIACMFISVPAVAQQQPLASWPDAWSPGVSWTTVRKDGRSGAETSRFSSEITDVKGDSIYTKSWRGDLVSRPASLEGVRAVRHLVMDLKTGMYGYSNIPSRLEYTPFEPMGCLPMELGKNCLSERFQFDVKSAQFPDWYSGTATEARYEKSKESFIVEKTGERLEVLRFVLSVNRNNGRYGRQYLFAPHFPFPMHTEVRYDSGALDWTQSIVEYKLR